jgi:hypothetical protein
MTLWELAACVDGYNAAHGDPDPEPMSSDEFDDMVSRHLPIVKGES